MGRPKLFTKEKGLWMCVECNTPVEIQSHREWHTRDFHPKGVQRTSLPAAPHPTASTARSQEKVTNTKNDTAKPSPRAPPCCLCGQVTNLASRSQCRRHYLRQLTLFQSCLPGSGSHKDSGRQDTCAKCLHDVKAVWDLNQEIGAIRENIASIVGRVKGALVKKCKKADTESKADQVAGERDPEDIIDGTAFVEIKHELPWSDDDEDAVGSERLVYNNVEKDSSQSLDKNKILGQVLNPEAAISSSHQSSASYSFRHKRSRSSNGMAKDPLATSDSEDSSSEQDSEVEEGPPKYKRLKRNTTTSHSKSICPHCAKVIYVLTNIVGDVNSKKGRI